MDSQQVIISPLVTTRTLQPYAKYSSGQEGLASGDAALLGDMATLTCSRVGRTLGASNSTLNLILRVFLWAAQTQTSDYFFHDLFPADNAKDTYIFWSCIIFTSKFPKHPCLMVLV